MPPARFQPPVRRSVALPRPHLVEALARHIDRKLQVIVAPAGFGKTSILSEFVHEVAVPACWVSLTSTDTDLADLAIVLVSALRTRYPRFGERTLAAVRGSTDIERSAGALARSFAADIEDAVEELTLLILDDFHDINDSAPVTHFLSDLLRVLPDNLRLLLASRVMPNLPIAQLTVAQELYSLGPTDLRFTAEELGALLHLRGIDDIPPEHMAELTSHSEGWIAGFLLAVSPMRTVLAGNALESGGADLVFDYLAGEVFERQPEEVQRFLLASSVPEVADPEICRVLLGPGVWGDMVRTVTDAGLFVTLVEDGKSAFRYHQLFRDFLQARLRRDAPDDYQRLHVLAGEYLAAQGEWQTALAHFRQVDAVAEAVRVVVGVVPQLEEQYRWRAVDAAVQGLFPDLLSDHPHVLLAAAWAAQRLGDFSRAVALAETAREEGARTSDRSIQARALARLGMISIMQGHMREAVEWLDRARTLTPSDAELVATVQFYQGQILGTTGDIRGAMAQFRAALTYFDESGPAMKAADAEHALATALDYAGRLTEAAARYESARARWRRLGNTDLESFELSALGDVHVRRGDYERARASLDEALKLVRVGGSSRTEAGVQRALGRLWLAVGEPGAAAESFTQGLAVARELNERGLQIHMLDGLALAAALQGDLGRAEEYAHQAVALAQRGEQRVLAAISSLTLGAIWTRTGRVEAIATLEQAADALTQMQAGWQMARAQTWLAQAHFRLGDETSAFDHLRSALDLAYTYGTDAVFDLHVRWDPALFEAACAAGVQPDRVRAALIRGSAVPLKETPDSAQWKRLVEVRGFGPGAILVDGKGVVVWKRDKSRELLFLLLQRGPQRSDQLTETLWPESIPARAHPRMHMAVSHLRSAVHPQIVARASGMYQVNEKILARYDVAEFTELLRQAAAATAEDAIPLLWQATDLYTAPFLADTSAEWCEIERDRLERLYLAALTRLADLHDAAGQYHECITVVERLLRTDPYREDAHARIIRAHLQLGNRAAALRQFQQCSRLLRRDLGVNPSPELMALLPAGER